jgi:hypothetical protein
MFPPQETRGGFVCEQRSTQKCASLARQCRLYSKDDVKKAAIIVDFPDHRLLQSNGYWVRQDLLIVFD